MAEGCGDACMPTIVECHHTTVGERKLYLALGLLAGYLTRHGAVYLVRQPVLAGYRLELQYIIKIFVDLVNAVGSILIMVFHGDIAHDRFG